MILKLSNAVAIGHNLLISWVSISEI